MRVQLYRENEKSGLIQTNDSAPWPVSVEPTEYVTKKGYDQLRVHLGNVLEIRMKTKSPKKPLMFSNNQNANYYFRLPIKFGYPPNIKSQNDYLDNEHNVIYKVLKGRKMAMMLKEGGQNYYVRCTIINPDLGKYYGYQIPKKLSKKLSIDELKFRKNDYLISKEKILKNDMHELQMKLDGIKFGKKDAFSLRQQKRRARLRRKVMSKIKSERVNVNSALNKTKKKLLLKAKRRINTKGKSIVKGYDIIGKPALGDEPKLDTKKVDTDQDVKSLDINNPNGPVKEETLAEKKIGLAPKVYDHEITSIIDKFSQDSDQKKEPNSRHDVRMDEIMEDETRDHQKDPKVEKDDSHETSYNSNVLYHFVKVRPNKRKFSIEKSLKKIADEKVAKSAMQMKMRILEDRKKKGVVLI